MKPNKKGEYQYVSGVMGMAYNPFLDSEAGGAHRNYEVAELLKFWTGKIVEIDTVERERELRFDSREDTRSNKCAALK